MKKKDFFLRTGLVLLLLLLLVTASILTEIYLKPPQDEETTPLSAVDNAQVTYIGKDTPVIQEIYYRQCRHLIRETVTGDSKFAEKSFGELRGEGWDISWSKDGQLTAFLEKDELCPEDAVKRHLGVYEGELAVYAGPSDSEGALMKVLGINIQDIYPKWQEMLANEGINFRNDEELMNALESLDEF